MATTPNYSWPTPDNTDLVRDGALAIRNLGNAVDTTVKTVNDQLDDVDVLTTKGDLLTTDGTDYSRLGVGADGEALVADSGQALGVKWAVVGGAFTELASGTLSGASVNLTAISQDFVHLILEVRNVRTNSGTPDFRVQVNSVTSSVYAVKGTTDATSTFAAQWALDTINTSDTENFHQITFWNYKDTGTRKAANHLFTKSVDTFNQRAFNYAQTTAITSIQMFLSANNFAGGTYRLLGVS